MKKIHYVITTSTSPTTNQKFTVEFSETEKDYSRADLNREARDLILQIMRGGAYVPSGPNQEVYIPPDKISYVTISYEL